MYQLTLSKVVIEPEEYSLHENIHEATSELVALLDELGLTPAGNLSLYKCEATGELIELSITRKHA